MKDIEKKLTIVAVGVDCDGKPWQEEMQFELVKAAAFEYGNKLSMIVHRPKWKQDVGVDVRYAGTSDIRKLAKMWLDDYFGQNLKSYRVV